MNTILFSPVGMTDPIRYFRDGAMLNIIRNYAPDEVYLYMSNEILKNHHRDNRYIYCIDKLSELLGKKIKVHIIERPELIDVQLFDSFISEFSDILNEIHNKAPESRILLNVSSGTPAMKSSLQELSLTLNFPMTPLQVATPQKQSNPRIDDEKNAAPEELWELNESNTEEDNRCSESQTKNLLGEFQKQTLIKLVRTYNYAAACELAEDMNISSKAKDMLEAANSRLKLMYGRCIKIFEKYKCNIRITDKKEFEEIAEYLLLLEIKVKKQEYADFVRAITPVIVRLFELYLKNKCDIDIDEYTTDINGVAAWDLRKMQGTAVLACLNNYYRGNFKPGTVYSDALYGLIRQMSAESNVKKLSMEIRCKVEKGIRNGAAHSIISVTNKIIKDNTGYYSEDIMKMLFDMLKYCGMNVSGNISDEYDRMNGFIMQTILNDN